MADGEAAIVYYTDSTPPTIPVEENKIGEIMLEAIPPVVAGGWDRVMYGLWQDPVTWAAWQNWSKQNAFDGDRDDNYTGLALRIQGRWETIKEGDLSFMCVGTTANGAVCIEAIVTGSELDYKTWAVPNT